MSQSKQAKREQFRVSEAEIGASADGASTLGGGGGSGGMLPREIFRFGFSKTHISRILWEN